MLFDLTFRFATAARYAPGAALLRWSVMPHTVPGDKLRFEIFRSSAPAGPWELAAEAPVGAFQYVDYDVYSPLVSRPYYYRIRALHTDGHGYLDTKPMLCAPSADHIATEMIRKKLTYMLLRTKGVAAVFVRRSWGPNCNRCYNQQRQVSSDADCPDCFGTGYSGGYLNPTYSPAIFNPGKKAIISSGVEYDNGQLYMELANVPIVSPLDLIVDVRSQIRYEVREVTPYTHAQTVVSQICAVNRIDENDVRYTLPVAPIESEEFGAGWDLLGEQNLRRALQEASPNDVQIPILDPRFLAKPEPAGPVGLGGAPQSSLLVYGQPVTIYGQPMSIYAAVAPGAGLVIHGQPVTIYGQNVTIYETPPPGETLVYGQPVTIFGQNVTIYETPPSSETLVYGQPVTIFGQAVTIYA